MTAPSSATMEKVIQEVRRHIVLEGHEREFATMYTVSGIVLGIASACRHPEWARALLHIARDIMPAAIERRDNAIVDEITKACPIEVTYDHED